MSICYRCDLSIVVVGMIVVTLFYVVVVCVVELVDVV